MRKIYIIIGIVLTLVLSAFVVPAETCDQPKIVQLWADGGDPATAFNAGYIEVCDDDAGTLYIDYHISAVGDEGEPWEMTVTHVHIGNSMDDFPLTKKGEPQVGRFEYNIPFDTPQTEYSLAIPYNGEDIIAVHGKIQTVCGYEPGVYDPVVFEEDLPDTVTFSVTYPVGGGPAYFPHMYINMPGGQIDVYGWCVDVGHVIYQNTLYNANVYSSYETANLAPYVDHPENMDKVNWILNQGFVGQPSICGGAYTYGDVQRAIWTLVDDELSTSGIGSWAQCRVDEILAGAAAYGGGFTPVCGDIIGVIFAPVEGGTQQVLIAQAVLGTFEFPCYEEPIYCEETFWAGELGVNEFPGKSWAMWFYYEYTPTDSVTHSRPFLNIIERFFPRIATLLEKLLNV